MPSSAEPRKRHRRLSEGVGRADVAASTAIDLYLIRRQGAVPDLDVVHVAVVKVADLVVVRHACAEPPTAAHVEMVVGIPLAFVEERTVQPNPVHARRRVIAERELVPVAVEHVRSIWHG